MMNTVVFEEFEKVNKEELTVVSGGYLIDPPFPGPIPYPDPISGAAAGVAIGAGFAELPPVGVGAVAGAAAGALSDY
ncbi:bacteriocin [Streptococcus tangpeifui]|uniref:bacteriocin n=1 Tax=Streptococcus tangpeifui TaxID=2709400 RepID=UPI0013ED3797|nr:bacteriocin [Streptococcus sp. ZJ373]